MRPLILGNIVSLIAAFFILAILILLGVYGLNFAFNDVTRFLMWIVWILAFPAYLEYRRSSLKAPYLINYLPPIAILITFVGLILLMEGKFLGLETIVLGYILEPISGISIYLTIKDIQKVSAHLFFYGAVIYTIGLPFYLINIPMIAIIGDLIKIVGLSYFISFAIKNYQ
ncbi:MAG: hypothetical protein TQ35_0009500 [Candidatus Aramenus sulfurataquae]|jgi:hypothetical protein|uniref:Uncharacterized protein n=4 Tax=Candidatus Aramenus sulfurataquae TaxID=1326980 RepID=A0AAE3FMI4_9CREN|nr:hypothetical protein [Candidatus Aramenus sulfurataquae]